MLIAVMLKYIKTISHAKNMLADPSWFYWCTLMQSENFHLNYFSREKCGFSHINEFKNLY